MITANSCRANPSTQFSPTLKKIYILLPVVFTTTTLYPKLTKVISRERCNATLQYFVLGGGIPLSQVTIMQM